jgi:ER-bound oxygenase mpaB/B'/Rubber oxygenase, catalytic domain
MSTTGCDGGRIVKNGIRLRMATHLLRSLATNDRVAGVLGSSLPDERLDHFRTIGDPLVDELLREYLEGAPRELGPLSRQLFGAPGLPAHPFVDAYLELIGNESSADAETFGKGQELFDLYGPEVLLVLGSCSLPLAYAAGNGVQVVARARRLKDDPIRRLCDTAQMVINVMQPGALAVGGVGWNSARKVRLIHALVRRYVQAVERGPWDPAWGTPINQEDQAGTLLTFSVGVLHGLRRMGATISSEQGDAYIRAWGAVGSLLGVEGTLLPATEADARALAARIGARQIRKTVEGQELTSHLLSAVDSLFPVPGYAVSLSHFFLDDTAFGSQVAQVLALPAPNWTNWLVRARAKQKRVTLRLLESVPGAKRRRSLFARHLVQRLLLRVRPDDSVPFEVPERLRRQWGLRAQS